MTKTELIRQFAKSSGGTLTKRAAGEFADTLVKTIISAIRAEGEFSYSGFGKFMLRTRKARLGRNPHTGETQRVKSSRTVGFKPTASFRASL